MEECRQLLAELTSKKLELEALRGGSEVPPNPRLPTLETYSPDDTTTTTFSLREALDSVPKYNGQNMTALAFSRACKQAKDMLPPYAEPTFARLVVNKLTNRAYAAIEDEQPRTIKELCDRVKAVFVPSYSIDAYRSELATIYQKPTEHVLDYIRRIKDLRCAILDCNGDINIEELDELALSSIVKGAISRIRLEFRVFQP